VVSWTVARIFHFAPQTFRIDADLLRLELRNWNWDASLEGGLLGLPPGPVRTNF